MNMADHKNIIISIYLRLLLCLTFYQCASSQDTFLWISPTNVILMKDVKISLFCVVRRANAAIDVSGGTFTWIHTRYNGGVSSYSASIMSEDPRIKVSNSLTSPSSNLVISNSNAEDSGIITCQYQYAADSDMLRTLSVNSTVNSKVPAPPVYLRSGQGDGTAAPIINTFPTTPMTSKYDASTIMKTEMSSPGLISSTSKSSSAPANSSTSHRFSMTDFITAVCVGGGGMLLIVAVLISVYIFCRQRRSKVTNTKDLSFELDGQYSTVGPSHVEREDSQQNPQYSIVQIDNKENLTSENETTEMHTNPIYVESKEPPTSVNDTTVMHNNPIYVKSLKERPQSSGHYDTVEDEGGDTPRPKMMPPSVNPSCGFDDYAYPSFHPSVLQSIDEARRGNIRSGSCGSSEAAAVGSQSEHIGEGNVPHYAQVNKDDQRDKN